jgi:hypothetical protein
MANVAVLAGAFSQANGMLFSIPLTFFSHLNASNKRPFATAVLVKLNPEEDAVGVAGLMVVEDPIIGFVDGKTMLASLLQAIKNKPNEKIYNARLK